LVIEARRLVAYPGRIGYFGNNGHTVVLRTPVENSCKSGRTGGTGRTGREQVEPVGPVEPVKV